MATTPPVNPQYPAQPPMGAPLPPAKKKMGPLGWVLIGCGGFAVLAIIVVAGLGWFAIHKAKQAGFDPDLLRSNPGLAAAKMVVAANPDLELISEDDERGIIRVHDRKQNKNFIVNFEDAKKGKLTLQEEGKEAVTMSASGNGADGSFEIKSSEGSFKMGGGGPVNLPSWVPSYPSSQPQATMTAEDPHGKHSSFNFKTGDSVDKVVSFYKDGFGSSGLKVANSSMAEGNGTTTGMISAKDDSGNREVLIIVANQNGETTVTVTYSEKK
jgi:hypothetical protein